MKSIAISIIVASLVIGGSILIGTSRLSKESRNSQPLISDDLKIKAPTITKEMVLKAITAPEVQDRLKNLNGFAIDPKKPLWIRATLDEKNIIVAYAIKHGDGSDGEFLLGFGQDMMGRWVADTPDPDIYINN